MIKKSKPKNGLGGANATNPENTHALNPSNIPYERSPVIRERGIRFQTKGDMLRALDLIEGLDREAIANGGRFLYEYAPISRNGLSGLMLPEGSCDRLLPLLTSHSIKFFEVKAVAVSCLPLEEQAKIRRRAL